MTINDPSIVRSVAFMACIATACARPAASQQQAGSAFPARPAGAACEQRLQRMRSIATPSVKREELLAGFVPLYACKDRELGQGIAVAIVAVRATTDSALASMAFNGAFAYRDSAIVRAAREVAADRGASELVRVLGFLSLYTTLAPGGYEPSLREFVAQPRGVVRCGFHAKTVLDALIANKLSSGMLDSATAALLREARTRAGLTQRELARRARTAQSVVARIESGATSPSWETLSRLLQAAGFALDATLRPLPPDHSHMLEDVPRILRLTPEQRLIELRNASRFLAAARRRA